MTGPHRAARTTGDQGVSPCFFIPAPGTATSRSAAIRSKPAAGRRDPGRRAGEAAPRRAGGRRRGVAACRSGRPIPGHFRRLGRPRGRRRPRPGARRSPRPCPRREGHGLFHGRRHGRHLRDGAERLAGGRGAVAPQPRRRAADRGRQGAGAGQCGAWLGRAGGARGVGHACCRDRGLRGAPHPGDGLRRRGRRRRASADRRRAARRDGRARRPGERGAGQPISRRRLFPRRRYDGIRAGDRPAARRRSAGRARPALLVGAERRDLGPGAQPARAPAVPRELLSDGAGKTGRPADHPDPGRRSPPGAEAGGLFRAGVAGRPGREIPERALALFLQAPDVQGPARRHPLARAAPGRRDGAGRRGGAGTTRRPTPRKRTRGRSRRCPTISARTSPESAKSRATPGSPTRRTAGRSSPITNMPSSC